MMRSSVDILQAAMRRPASRGIFSKSKRADHYRAASLPPFRGCGRRPLSTSGATDSSLTRSASTMAAAPTSFNTNFELVKIPSLPVVGSMIPWHSGMPPQDLTKVRENTLRIKQKFGHFYRIGFPGMGVDSHGTMYVVSDPHEYMKIIRHEGKYPSGLLESLWPMHKSLGAIDAAIVRGDNRAFFGRGAEWKRIRNFLQTDLLSPSAANGYLPGVIRAAELAAKGAPACSTTLNDYLHRCAFDMFTAVMFGELCQVADPNTPTDPTNLQFVTHAANFVATDAKALLSPSEAIMNLFFQRQTEKITSMVESARVTFEISRSKIQAFAAALEAGTLDDLQQQSYLAAAMKRLQDQSGTKEEPIDDELFVNICWMMLTASVDTTSGVMAWALVHTALNPDMQDKLRQELQGNLAKDGKLSPEIFTKRANVPYLNAFLRESHRVTPSIIMSMTKEVSEEIEIHGVAIPPNNKFGFDQYSLTMEPELIDGDPHTFDPERWFPEAVQARKGTPKELIDHPFFKDPFSQGARKCPGSRVAMNEVFSLLSQLILDYDIRCPGHDSYVEIPYTMEGVLTPQIPHLEFTPRK